MITNDVHLKIKKRDIIQMSVDGLTEIELHAIAGQVERQMAELEKKTLQPDTGKLAIMTAMEFAIELYNLKRRYENNKEADSKKIDEMVTALEGVLNK